MCGIVGYIGHREAYPILLGGLRRLEYRGYDSAGVALLNGHLAVHKRKGKVDELAQLLEAKPTPGRSGIGHTRWATHGPPNEANAHPHVSPSGRLALVHNGIIENYAALKSELQKGGSVFKSETDTETLAHLIEAIQRHESVPFFEAVRIALGEVVGAYAVAIISEDSPDELIVARKGSPLVVGVGDGEFLVASDAAPIIGHTRDVVYLKDEEIAVLPRNGEMRIKTVGNVEKPPYVQKLELSLEAIEKGGYESFMLKEIYEQPRSIRDSMRGRLDLDGAGVVLGGIRDFDAKLAEAERVIFVGCGTSWHAGLVGERLFEDLARTRAEVEYASEFRYRNPILSERDIVIAISQSGETADTRAAIELAKSKGATVLGVCNVVGSTIARETDGGCYTHAGPEIGVASTKAFTSQVTVLALMALRVAQSKGALAESRFRSYAAELARMPEIIERTLQCDEKVKAIAAQYKDARNALFLGRGYGFPTALEGALKLKEVSYIHAEGYPAAEMKHGPIALVDEAMPVVVIATQGPSYDKIMSNIQEVKARGGRILAIATENDREIGKLADHVIEIPATDEIFIPLVSIIPLQLFAYHVAVMRGCDVDRPRNLAKSVTVE